MVQFFVSQCIIIQNTKYCHYDYYYDYYNYDY